VVTPLAADIDERICMTNESGHAAASSGHDDLETRRGVHRRSPGPVRRESGADGRRRSVQLSATGPPELPDLFTALKQCLDESAIAAVKVELDGQAYAMEGLSSGSR
jgi:hypothetical protein